MLIVETIAKIRRLFRNEHRSIREISRELRLSRKVVRKVQNIAASRTQSATILQGREQVGEDIEPARLAEQQEAVVLDLAEQRAVLLLAAAGLVPALRHREAI